ncbi:hypothetical protein V8J36_17540 [Frigidibacter sp. MR17.14]|uniref:hypothetical protein n=1 Tax=Frigidibacter sp. MR17.14 TaxID=3126509 RepID=UPI003012D5FD
MSDAQPIPPTASQTAPQTAARGRSRLRAVLAAIRPIRMPLRHLSFLRLLRGGKPGDLGRLPRYFGFFAMGAALIWAPIAGYLATAQERFTSEISLILPGSGAQASVNLDQIGQASSAAASPFSSSSISPTETYKRLIAADRILDAASRRMGMRRRDFGSPRIELVDQTGLIRLSLTGNSPEDAQARGEALLAAFFAEIDALRHDEQTQRTDSEGTAIEDYRRTVAATREEVAKLQRETGLISAQQYATLVSDSDALKVRIADLSGQRDERDRTVAAMQAALGLTPAEAAAVLKLQADPGHTALAQDMAAAGVALSAARGSFGPSHPTRRAAEERFATARARLAENAAQVTGLPPAEAAALDLTQSGERAGLLRELVTADSERSGLAAELAALTLRGQQMQARVLALIEPAARLEDGERNFRVAEAVLASAMARSKTSKADLYASYPLVQVLEDPSLPEEPSSPKRKLALAAGGAATVFLFGGLFLAWMRRPLIGRLLAGPQDEIAEGAPA